MPYSRIFAILCIYNKRVSQSVANNSRRFKDKSEWIVREDVYPPLISLEQFTGIQERMKRRKVSNQAHPKEVYLLSGKVHCGLCGRAYCGERKMHDVVVYPDRIVVIFNLFPHIRITDKPPDKTNEEPSAEEGSFSVPDMVMFELDREGKSEESGADILRRLR